MRVAFATWSNRRAGGVETYLETVVPEVQRLGHDVALWHQTTEPSDRAAIDLPPGTQSALLPDIPAAIEARRWWRPDVVFVQGLDEPPLEAALLQSPGAVFVAHNYAGTCISGTRAWTLPVVRPCHREFGPLCLAHYLPHGCGGKSVATMWRLYVKEQSRQRSLRATPIVTLSAHMRDVFLQHGFDREQVVHVPYGTPEVASPPPRRRFDGGTTLITVARLERLKGVHLLIDALPAVHQAHAGDLELVIVGDGRARSELERQASALTASNPGINVTFAGWTSPAERDRLLQRSQALVLPSAWPEPLGVVGMEAVRLNLPVIAFDVGGIRDWLVDGVNGRLVRADPPTADALARAIADTLSAGVRGTGGVKAPPELPTPASHARHLMSLAGRLRERKAS